MNLIDLLDEDGLKQDEWSLTAPKFGSEGQLTVVGWSGKTNGNKFYILKCGACSEDPELFAGGYFISLKGGLLRGQLPCGCSKGTRYSDYQWGIVISRMLTSKDHVLLNHYVKNSSRYAHIVCGACREDEELFGDGTLNVLVSELRQGAISCGCSPRHNWTKTQYSILCSRAAENLGYKFIGFQDPWLKANTRIDMLCKLHGQWSSGSINNLINNGYGCPACKSKTISESKIKPDDVMVKSFFSSGGFHPDTKFWRSERQTKQGSKIFWHVSCPECGQFSESSSNNLQKGKRPCACSPMRQLECYINFVKDGEQFIAVKFGIARDSSIRLAAQNRKSPLCIESHEVYYFPDVASCKKAERECKQQLECCVVLKRDMPDGYTETTWSYNLDKIKKIYTDNGGIKL